MNLSHLIPESRRIAKLSDAERIKRIHADRWIEYPLAKAALDRLEQLLAWPAKQRMPNLLIIGPTNNGKSMIIEKFRRKHCGITPREYESKAIPVVVVQMPSDPGIARFYVRLLSSMGTGFYGRKTFELENAALIRIRAIKAKMLVIDELHNLLAGPSDVRSEFLNLLRFLGNELKIPIVCLGTRDAYLAIRTDDQLENRFEPFLLPKWEEGTELFSLLTSFAETLPLRRPSKFITPNTAVYILERTGGTIGEIAAFLSAAAIRAIESGDECINSKALTFAKYESPSNRKKTFERALRY